MGTVVKEGRGEVGWGREEVGWGRGGGMGKRRGGERWDGEEKK